MTKPPFTNDEILLGRASELRQVQTPKPGETVEVGYILTDAVLCVNKLVEEVLALRALVEAQGGPIKFEKSEEFSLPSLGKSYEES